ncbi:MAG: ribosome small subunit-dependent GTPase A [Ardenticatenaceae bacterium]|nr:ribosome small subunit-dependent GTPase A [Ardenticatenaceae bacterium]
MNTEESRGRVVKAQSGFFWVKTQQHGVVVSQLPGRMKKDRQNTDLTAVGDWVTITLNKDKTGTIATVEERHSTLSRTRPVAGSRSLRSDREQVLIANVDQVVFVFAAKNPEPNLRKLDRFLVVAEMNELPAIICLNKIDLIDLAQLQQEFALYETLGYEVVYTSVKTGYGVETLRQQLAGKLSVFAGSSGVGKSSLLNAIQPGLGLQVKDVSEATGKGMHTTRYTEMFPLDVGGYVADTPGIRGLALFDVEPSELDAYFREIAPLVADCQFSNCTHRNEPKCAVRAAVADGRIAPQRYESYLRLREEHDVLDQAMY